MSGHAIQGAEPILAPLAEYFSKRIIERLKYVDPTVKATTVGSVGKKLNHEYHGDIDIAIQCDTLDEMSEIIRKAYPSLMQVSRGNIISIGFIHNPEEMEIVQVDFMRCDSLDWAKVYWGAPVKGSKYKGGAAMDLLSIIVSEMPTIHNHEVEYFDDGQVKRRWKMTLNSSGVYEQLLNYEGKKGRLKNPERPKDKQILICNTERDFVHLLFTGEIYMPMIYDFPVLWQLMMTRLKHPEIKDLVIERFIKECQPKWNIDSEDMPLDAA